MGAVPVKVGDEDQFGLDGYPEWTVGGIILAAIVVMAIVAFGCWFGGR